MRFLLDQNVDARASRVVTAQGHQCSTVAEANLGDAADDDITVYATDRRAILVTHDREFSHRRRRHVIGHHLYLRCADEDAVGLLSARLEDIVQAFQQGPDIFVQVSANGLSLERRWE